MTFNLDDIKNISLLFPGDLYELGNWLAKINDQKSRIQSANNLAQSVVIRTTANGLADLYSRITGIPDKIVKEKLKENEIDLGATFHLNTKS